MAADDVRGGLDRARERIRKAEAAAGRPEGSVRLLAVSKTQPAEAIREAYAAGQRDFGENYVQELVTKAAALADLPGLRWHFIGQLQTNKVRAIVPFVSCVHSVDSLKLLQEFERRMLTHGGRTAAPEAAQTRGRLSILLEVSVAGEAQKGGCIPEDLGALLEAGRASRHLAVVGLMAIPPLSDDPAASQPYFERLRELRDRHGGAPLLPELSMGMSSDCEVAIACGATWVRVGTAIFGARGRPL